MGEPNCIGWAVKQIWDGKRVSRPRWNGKNMWIAIMYPGPNSDMTVPYIYMFSATGDLVPWLASQFDILATDWMIV